MQFPVVSVAPATKRWERRGDAMQASSIRHALRTQEAKCQYPSKCCDKLRAFKRDGNLHKLCEFHRAKANRNQRKHERNRRLHKYVALRPNKQRETSNQSHVIEESKPSIKTSLFQRLASPAGSPPTPAPVPPTKELDAYELEPLDSTFDMAWLDECPDQSVLCRRELKDVCIDQLVGYMDLFEEELIAPDFSSNW